MSCYLLGLLLGHLDALLNRLLVALLLGDLKKKTFSITCSINYNELVSYLKWNLDGHVLAILLGDGVAAFHWDLGINTSI